jgi:putative two-component system response regulator
MLKLLRMSRKPTLLIADDDVQAVNILEQILLVQGYDVIKTFDGQQARDLIFEKKPDLVILDNFMPNLTGIQICREIKANPETRLMPVVMLTGYTETPEKVESLEAGVDDFLHKPFKTLELTARLKSLLKVKFLNDELDSAEGIIFALARAIEAKDKYTQGHTERVSQFALALGYKMGLSSEEQNALHKGGILHDIGKIAIPDAILNKPSRLTEQEFNIIKTHPDRGEKICMPLNSIKSSLQVIRYHHERMDGSGYPDRLSKDDIPVTARIMAIVDVYDALTSNRSYRLALPREKAFTILSDEAERGWWDRDVLKEFRSLVTTA